MTTVPDDVKHRIAEAIEKACREHQAAAEDQAAENQADRRSKRRVSLVPFLADDQYQWFYWIAPILALSGLGLIVMLSIGYVRRC